MSIEARPASVAIDATSMVVVSIAPNAPIAWGLVGNGTLEPLSLITDANGVAAAKLTPTGAPGDALTVSVTYLEDPL